MVSYILGFLGGYLVGSFPTGYIVVRHRAGINITRAGSGNAGALNAGIITGSKFTGIIVGVIDAAKGLAVVLIARAMDGSFPVVCAGLVGAVLGHNYPVWLRFRGGRGLATACGGLFGIGVSYTIVWCTTWMLVKLFRQRVLTANIAAILVTPVLLFFLPEGAVSATMIASGEPMPYRWFSLVLSGIFLLSHLNAIGKPSLLGDNSKVDE